MSLFGDIASVAAPIAGAYFGGSTGAAIGNAIGSALNSSQAGSQAAEANKQVGQGLQFRPVGVTNTFGTSNFGYDPTTGQLTSAGYSLSPFLQQYQNALTGASATSQNLSDLNSQLGLARQYLASTPQELGQNWMSAQQAYLQPSRSQQWANAAQTNFNKGTGGLSVAQGEGLQAANPIAAAVANAQALQDLQLASQAQQQGQSQYAWGQNLLSSAYSPLKTSLGITGAVEQLGQNPYELSTNLASQVQGAAKSAAPYQYNAASYNPTTSLIGGLLSNNQLMSGVGSLFGNNYGGTSQGAYAQQDQYLAGAMANPQTQQAKILAAQNAGLFD